MTTAMFGRPSFIAPQNVSGEEPTRASIQKHFGTYAQAFHTTVGILGNTAKHHNNEQQGEDYTPASARI